MAKWSALIVVMLMVVTVMVVTAESDKATGFIRCFRKCYETEVCEDNDGNCFERCKIKCGGPNPPHGPGGPLSPPHSF
ncbi:unnamed protein product [Eruca vesicaria subsp. sativa]|uniref:Plant thionin family protein n=1 Tax=Eruca vesicaria subsp. sativa TaxID=29727 RepID=A0ABC8L355_ERUVS|nr:unnamed protein product [Eruca vesicaria subsp. sativa]CAH8372582.1 unnamed protein product [Eruca vesicaria subsp. sativa]